MGQGKVQNYVVVRNLRKSPSMFSSHQQAQIILQAFGSKEDSVKIIMSDDNIVGQMRHYDTLRKGGDFQVSFSTGLDGSAIPDSVSKMTVHSTAEVTNRTAGLVAQLRAENESKARTDKNAEARLALAKAQAVARGAKPELKAKAKDEAAPARTAASEDVGVELTPEYLNSRSRADLYEIAAKLGLNLRGGASKGGMVKAILLNLK